VFIIHIDNTPFESFVIINSSQHTI